MSLQIDTQQEAFLAIMYACMSVDERITEEETDALIRSLMKEPLLKEANIIQLYKKIQQIHQSVRFDSYRLIELAAPHISQEYKAAIINVATHILQADGVVLATERGLLQHLRTCLYPDTAPTI